MFAPSNNTIMKKLLYLLIFLLPIGLSSCNEIQKKFQDLKISTIGAEKSASNQKVETAPSVTASSMVDAKDSKTGASGYFVLADGTYSNTTDYVVPNLTTDFLERLINKVRIEGGGLIWVSYIDAKSRDNESLFIKVRRPVAGGSQKPNFMTNGAINFKKNKAAWEAQNHKAIMDSALEAQQFSKMKQEFLDNAYSLLKNKVYLKSVRNQLSDVVGSLESAMKVLTDAKRNNAIKDCSIIGFSDFENDPKCKALQLNPAVKVYNLISQPGKSKSVIPSSMEVIDTDYLFSIL